MRLLLMNAAVLLSLLLALSELVAAQDADCGSLAFDECGTTHAPSAFTSATIDTPGTCLTTGACSGCDATSARVLNQKTLRQIQHNPNGLGTNACLVVDGIVTGDLKLTGTGDCVLFDSADDFWKGTIDTGAGDDCVRFFGDPNGRAQLLGRLDMGEGADTLAVESAKITGRVTMGFGDDLFVISHDAETNTNFAAIDGGVSMGPGDDTVNAQGTACAAGTSPSAYNLVSVDLIELREGNDVARVGCGLFSIVDGGDGNDVIEVISGAIVELVDAEDGDDTITTGGPVGTDALTTANLANGVAISMSLLDAGDGSDCMLVGQGNDNTAAAGFVDRIHGGRGDDTLSVSEEVSPDAMFVHTIGGPIQMGDGFDEVSLRNANVNNFLDEIEDMCLQSTNTAVAFTINGDVTLASRAVTNTEFDLDADTLYTVNGLWQSGTARNADSNTCTFNGGADVSANGQDELNIVNGFCGCSTGTVGAFAAPP